MARDRVGERPRFLRIGQAAPVLEQQAQGQVGVIRHAREPRLAADPAADLPHQIEAAGVDRAKNRGGDERLADAACRHARRRVIGTVRASSAQPAAASITRPSGMVTVAVMPGMCASDTSAVVLA